MLKGQKKKMFEEIVQASEPGIVRNVLFKIYDRDSRIIRLGI